MITLKPLNKKFMILKILFSFMVLLSHGITHMMEPPEKPLSPDILKKLTSFFNKPVESIFGFQGYNDLMRALILGDEAGAQKIIERDPAQIKVRNSNKLTPLHFAAAFSSVSMIQCLLDHGGTALINDNIYLRVGSPWYWRPLDFAIVRRNPDPTLCLLSRGATANEEHLFGAIERGNLATVYALLHHGVVLDPLRDFQIFLNKIPDLQICNEMKRLLAMFGIAFTSGSSINDDPLENAARCGQLADVKRLLTGAWYIPHFIHNYFTYSPGQIGRALAYAICRHPHISRLLLKAGAQFHDVEPIVEAFNQRQIIKRRDYEEFERLNRVTQDAEIQEEIENRRKELAAADLMLYEETQRIIDARDNPLFHDLSPSHERKSSTYFHLLPPHILRTVLAYKNGQLWGAQHNNPEGITAQQQLVTAISESDMATVRLLLAQGANPNVCSQCTHHPLLYKAYYKEQRYELIKLLLDHGAYPNPELELTSGIRFFDFIESSPSLGTVIEMLLMHWDKMDHSIESDYALAFGLQLRSIFLLNPEKALEACENLLKKIETRRARIKDPREAHCYDGHLYNQVTQFYGYFIKKVIYEESEALWTETGLLLNYDGVLELLLRRWPHVGAQITHLLLQGSQRARVISGLLNTISIDTPEIIRQVEQLYSCLVEIPEIYETLFFSYRDIIPVLLDRWPYRQLALKLEAHYKILGQKLVLAAQQGAINQVKRLLEQGVNPNKCKVEGSSLLEFLVLHQHYKNSMEREKIIKIITLLLSQGADGNPTRGEGTTGLLVRLVNDPSYRHFVAARIPILLHLLNELERRRQLYPQLRLRLQAAAHDRTITF